jgi:hypothetical protein
MECGDESNPYGEPFQFARRVFVVGDAGAFKDVPERA